MHNRGIAWYARRITTRRSPITTRPSGSIPRTPRPTPLAASPGTQEGVRQGDRRLRLRRSGSTRNHALAYNGRGFAWCDKKDYDKAIADYDEAIRLDPKFASAHFNRSVAQMLMRRGSAVRRFRQVIDVEGWKGDRAVYAVILGHLAARQSGDEPAAKALLDDAAGKLDATAWPYAAVRFCAARSTSRHFWRWRSTTISGPRPTASSASIAPQKAQGRGSGSLPMGERARQPEVRRVHDRAGRASTGWPIPARRRRPSSRSVIRIDRLRLGNRGCGRGDRACVAARFSVTSTVLTG